MDKQALASGGGGGEQLVTGALDVRSLPADEELEVVQEMRHRDREAESMVTVVEAEQNEVKGKEVHGPVGNIVLVADGGYGRVWAMT